MHTLDATEHTLETLPGTKRSDFDRDTRVYPDTKPDEFSRVTRVDTREPPEYKLRTLLNAPSKHFPVSFLEDDNLAGNGIWRWM